MKCFGCQRALEVGDQYIEDTASGFIGAEDGGFDGIVADMFGCGGKIVLCVDCTQPGGEYLLETVYGDEEES
jgi:hypothetical protein